MKSIKLKGSLDSEEISLRMSEFVRWNSGLADRPTLWKNMLAVVKSKDQSQLPTAYRGGGL